MERRRPCARLLGCGRGHGAEILCLRSAVRENRRHGLVGMAICTRQGFAE
nr:MAG TPA: hypothetical protein [Caudoviricetes sp.]